MVFVPDGDGVKEIPAGQLRAGDYLCVAQPESLNEWKVEKRQVESITPYLPRHRTKFDITVEGNSNYFAGGALVHNSPETTPGGHALEFQATVRLRVALNAGKSQEHDIIKEMPDGTKRKVGRNSRVTVAKNRLGKPFGENIDIGIYYEEYFPDTETVLFELGRQVRVIGYRLGEYKWRDITVSSIEDFWKHVSLTDLKDELIAEIAQQADEKGQFLPPEVAEVVLEARKKVASKPSVAIEEEQQDSNEDGTGTPTKLRKGRKSQADSASE
ncbi:MAG: hypothetical protein HC888_00380 [Candidatus Competibacteraceae bacterium]|nr:hypothetical protein [Candidatus Competibacteraceae bacterium]